MPLPYPWLERPFDFDLPVAMFPDLVERLRGAPARLEDHVRGLTKETLTKREGDTWSIQENAGHLWEIDALPAQRLTDFLAGAETLTPWAGNNDATNAASFNDRDINEITASFRQIRSALVDRLDTLSESDFARTSIHPRLNKPMRLIDLCEFHAQHDDYHLATITQLKRRSR